MALVLRAFFREMIQHRLDHCESELEKHLEEAGALDEFRQIIVWKGGHFSVPVWKALKESENLPIKEWNSLIWEQIIRQMGRENKHFEPILWDIASEGCLISFNYGL